MLPTTAWININNVCNNKCIWCYAKDVNLAHKTMPYLQIGMVLERLVLIGCKKCVLIGGEPTLHPQIIDIFANAKEKGLEVKIVSNGRRFADIDFCQDMIGAGLKTKDITLSMHSGSEDESFILTGSKEYFGEFKQGLENLLSLNVVPYINITLSKSLFYQTNRMMSWLVDRGLSSVAFNLGAPAVSQYGVDAGFTLSPDILAIKVFELFQYGKQIGIKTGFLFNVPLCLLSVEELKLLLRNGAVVSGCQILSGKGILFNVDGNLVMCNHLLDFEVFGKERINEIIDTGHFSQFWLSETMQKIRDSVCVFRSEKCQICDYWNICGGGCPIFWTNYDPRKFIPGYQKERR